MLFSYSLTSDAPGCHPTQGFFFNLASWVPLPPFSITPSPFSYPPFPLQFFFHVVSALFSPKLPPLHSSCSPISLEDHDSLKRSVCPSESGCCPFSALQFFLAPCFFLSEQSSASPRPCGRSHAGFLEKEVNTC